MRASTVRDGPDVDGVVMVATVPGSPSPDVVTDSTGAGNKIRGGCFDSAFDGVFRSIDIVDGVTTLLLAPLDVGDGVGEKPLDVVIDRPVPPACLPSFDNGGNAASAAFTGDGNNDDNAAAADDGVFTVNGTIGNGAGAGLVGSAGGPLGNGVVACVNTTAIITVNQQ
jgi:hypothetical protein